METESGATVVFKTVYITGANCISPLGEDLETNWSALIEGKSAIQCQGIGMLSQVYVAKFGQRSFEQQEEGGAFLEYLLIKVAKPLLVSKKITARTGLVLSTTKGNIDKLGEDHPNKIELGLLARKVASKLGFTTDPIVVSHACVSGVLAVSVGKRLIQMGQYDEVLVIAGDEASEFVLSGFQSFQAMSSGPCRPFDAHRDGVTLGEAAAAVWLSTDPMEHAIQIAGEGSVNDANHISGPSRTGEGLVRSIHSALAEARISASDVDFISAHGTATLYNDEMEAIAFDRVGLAHCPTNSLKGYYGHTLGASGLLELTIAIKSMQEKILIPSKGFTTLGTSKYLNIIEQLTPKSITYCLKTASGFGGSNSTMILKKG